MLATRTPQRLGLAKTLAPHPSERSTSVAEPTVAPYGSWKSPITSDLIVSETIRLGEILLDGETVYWTELGPAEGGRYVIVRRTPDGETADPPPPPLNPPPTAP